MLRCPPQLRHTAIRLIAGVAVMLAVGGCAVKHPTANLVSGKVMFQKTCGSCHTLSHASTSGTTGPNLDDAFRQDKTDGVKDTSIQGLVDSWIRYPNTQGVMPGGLLKGQDAQDVAAYVAAVAARPGQDTGALAAAGGVPGHHPGGRQAGVHRAWAGARQLPHAGRGGHPRAPSAPNLDTDSEDQLCATAQPPSQIRGATLEQRGIRTAIIKPYAYLPSGYKAGVMPANFAQTLKPNEITALVNFLSTAAK